MTKTTKKSSAKRKLIPAVGMLTTSAIMLSSATYAWFTMNKEVQVTGLSMSATSSDGLEISLGALASVGANPTAITAPGKDDVSWKRSIQFSDYYKSVAKLMPASSNTALTMYAVDTKKVFAGGRDVEEGADITSLKDTDMAALALQTESTKTFVVNGDANPGYYLDIPMWIRASNNSETEIEGTITITDGITNSPAEDLMKAVRVAIIPVDSANSGATLAASDKYKAESGVVNTYEVDNRVASTSTIFGLKATLNTQDYPTYNGKVIAGGPTYSTDTLANVTVNEAASALTDNNAFEGTNDANTTPATVVFKMPAATENDYSGVSFIARIWIEGESVYCQDATANQDWQIDFHFNTKTPAAVGP